MICSAITVLPSVPRVGRDIVEAVPAPALAPRAAVEGDRVEVVGPVEAVWETWQIGTWRVVVGGHVVFASAEGGALGALMAAWRAGEEVSVTARRRCGDCYVDGVRRL